MHHNTARGNLERSSRTLWPWRGGQGPRGPGGLPLHPASEGKGWRRSGGSCRSESAHAGGANESHQAFITRTLLGGRGRIHARGALLGAGQSGEEALNWEREGRR